MKLKLNKDSTKVFLMELTKAKNKEIDSEYFLGFLLGFFYPELYDYREGIE